MTECILDVTIGRELLFYLILTSKNLISFLILEMSNFHEFVIMFYRLFNNLYIYK